MLELEGGVFSWSSSDNTGLLPSSRGWREARGINLLAIREKLV